MPKSRTALQSGGAARAAAGRKPAAHRPPFTLWTPPADRAQWTLLGFRWLAVGCQATTLWITWPLWQAREAPAMLPLFDLPQVSFGPLLLASLLVVLVAPRSGIALHAGLLLGSVLFDQTRWQPYSVSLLLLMAGTLPNRTVRLLARAHLASLWFYAGLHKLLNPTFPELMQRMVEDVAPAAPAILASVLCVIIWASEMSLGLLATTARWRWLLAAWAFILHAAVTLALGLGLGWSPQVWPWNWALALAGIGLVVPWRSTLWDDAKQAALPARMVACFLLVMPLGYYLGLVDQFTAYSVYSGAPNPAAYIRSGDEVWNLTDSAWHGHNVVLQPAHRTYEAFFQQVGLPGEVLVLRDDRWIASKLGFAERDIPYEEE